jgi:surface polysaccharide O-acyltransferase-like enzyme
MVVSPNAPFPTAIRKIMKPAVSVWLLAVLFAIETILVQPDNFVGYANSFHGLLLGFVGFFFGMLAVSVGPQVFNHFRVMCVPSIAIAFGLYLIRVIFRGMYMPDLVQLLAVGIESALWIIGIFGIAGKLLNRPSKTLSYLSKAVYPVYIFHLPIENVLSLAIFELKVSGEVQFIMLIAGTVGLSFGVYELVKRVEFLRPLFGMKLRNLSEIT